MIMAENQPLSEDLNHYTVQRFMNALTDFSSSIRSQRYIYLVKPFDGDSSTYNEWLRSIEKYRLLAKASEADLRCLAIAMTRGVASDFIQCYATAFPNKSWNQMKEALSQRFAPISDPDHTFVFLQEWKQEEFVDLLPERLIGLAEEAFCEERDRPPESSESSGDGKTQPRWERAVRYGEKRL